MRRSAPLRSLVVLSAVLTLLVAAGCRRGNVSSTLPPEIETASPGPQTAGEFTLLGEVQQAFLGTSLPIEASFESRDLPTGYVSAPNSGVMRVLLQEVSDELNTRCDADEGDRINVFWTSETGFDPALLEDDPEETMDDRTVGVVGDIFVAPDLLQTEPSTTLAPASPDASPGATSAIGDVNTDCVLIAVQIGTSSGTLPTTRPRTVTRTTAPPTATPTASPTATPTKSPSATATATAPASPATSP